MKSHSRLSNQLYKSYAQTIFHSSQDDLFWAQSIKHPNFYHSPRIFRTGSHFFFFFSGNISEAWDSSIDRYQRVLSLRANLSHSFIEKKWQKNVFFRKSSVKWCLHLNSKLVCETLFFFLKFTKYNSSFRKLYIIKLHEYMKRESYVYPLRDRMWQTEHEKTELTMISGMRR